VYLEKVRVGGKAGLLPVKVKTTESRRWNLNAVWKMMQRTPSDGAQIHRNTEFSTLAQISFHIVRYIAEITSTHNEIIRETLDSCSGWIVTVTDTYALHLDNTDSGWHEAPKNKSLYTLNTAALPLETFEMRNPLVTLALAKSRQNSVAIFKRYELFL
jgi:hypothetical protein